MRSNLFVNSKNLQRLTLVGLIAVGVCLATNQILATQAANISTLEEKAMNDTIQPEVALREENKKLVLEYLRLLEAMDIDSWIELWAENAVQEMPYAPEGFPTRFEGKQTIYHHFKDLRQVFSVMRFPVSNLRTLEDPEWVLAEFRGEIDVKAGGNYNNRYAVLFHIKDGKILLAREYFNPNVLTESSHYRQIAPNTNN